MNVRERLAAIAGRATIAAALLLVASASFAQFSWTAGPPSADRAFGLQSDGLTSPALSQPLQGEPGAVTIQRITWWGYYSDAIGALVADGAPPYIDNFAVSFNDGAVPVSGGSLAKVLDPVGGGNVLTRYELTGLSLALDSVPTTLDLLNRFNDGTGANLADAQWFWQGNGLGDRAYRVEGVYLQPIPEPKLFVMLAVGLALVGIVCRGRKSAH